MSVTPDDFLLSAQRLRKNNPKEIDLRNAISRTYYCCYHYALRLDKELIDNSGINTKAGVHEQLISKFTNYPLNSNLDDHPKDIAISIRSIGYILKDLKVYRSTADYKLNDEITLNDAEAASQTAERFLKKLNNSLMAHIKTA